MRQINKSRRWPYFPNFKPRYLGNYLRYFDGIVNVWMLKPKAFLWFKTEHLYVYLRYIPENLTFHIIRIGLPGCSLYGSIAWLSNHSWRKQDHCKLEFIITCICACRGKYHILFLLKNIDKAPSETSLRSTIIQVWSLYKKHI